MRSDCSKARELMAADVDGDLTPAFQHELAGHLQACAACQREAAGLRLSIALLARLPQPEPEPAFIMETMRRARLARRAQEARAQRLVRLWALVALVLGAAGIAALSVSGTWETLASRLLALLPAGIRLLDGTATLLANLRDTLAPVVRSLAIGVVDLVDTVLRALGSLGQSVWSRAMPIYAAALLTLACLAALSSSRLKLGPAHVERMS
jgi:predicted anti-sigma-YlaC factor YlaD